MTAGFTPARAGRAALLAGILAAAWWALRPLPTVPIPPPRLPILPEDQIHGPPARVALDTAAFHAPLWIAPPAPPSPPPPPSSLTPKPEPPPLKLQILAIVGGKEGEQALLYDPDTDRSVWVKAGHALGSRTVERVLAGAVQIRDGPTMRTLSLRTDPAADTPLERMLRSSGGGGP